MNLRLFKQSEILVYKTNLNIQTSQMINTFSYPSINPLVQHLNQASNRSLSSLAQLFQVQQSFKASVQKNYLDTMMYYQALQTQALQYQQQSQSLIQSIQSCQVKKLDCCSTTSAPLLQRVELPNLKSQVAAILSFILENHDNASKQDYSEERAKYINNPRLLALFDMLLDRYVSSTKCREDMVRFVFRKAISCLRNSLRKENNLTTKAASLLLCQRYFKLDSVEITGKINVEDEDQILNFLLPYKKNSRNKTANSSFITEIFSSEVFHEDYVKYLGKIDGVLNEDNQKKIEKFVDFLVACVENNTFDKIKNYKRLPWLKVWLEATKVLGHELLNANSWKNFTKNPTFEKTKKQKTSPSSL